MVAITRAPVAVDCDLGRLHQDRVLDMFRWVVFALANADFILGAMFSVCSPKVSPPLSVERLQSHIMLGGMCTAGVGAVVSGPSRQLDQAVEDAELELELDAVHERLPGGLDVVEVCEFEAEDGDVEENNEDVDVDQMVQDGLRFRVAQTLF